MTTAPKVELASFQCYQDGKKLQLKHRVYDGKNKKAELAKPRGRNRL